MVASWQSSLFSYLGPCGLTWSHLAIEQIHKPKGKDIGTACRPRYMQDHLDKPDDSSCSSSGQKPLQKSLSQMARCIEDSGCNTQQRYGIQNTSI